MIRLLPPLLLTLAQAAFGAEPAYPTKPVRLVVPAAAAGGTDYVARLIAQKLTEALGQPVIVDNRAVVDGIMGTATVAEARPDGYTLMLTDLIAGQTQLSIAPAISAIPHAKAGRLNALAAAGAKRSAAMPDLPTMAEAGVPGYEASIWTGMFAPAKTAQAIIRRVNVEVNQIVRAREFGERLVNSGAEPAGGTPEEWTAFLRNEIAKWAKIAKIAGMKAE